MKKEIKMFRKLYEYIKGFFVKAKPVVVEEAQDVKAEEAHVKDVVQDVIVDVKDPQ